MPRPRIRRIASDLVEITIGGKVYHVISDETPILDVNKFVMMDSKPRHEAFIGTEREKILIWYHEFRQREEFGVGNE